MTEENTLDALRLNVGLGTTVLRQIGNFVFEDVKGGREPLFELTKSGYLHQSGYGFLSPDRVIVVPNVELTGSPKASPS